MRDWYLKTFLVFIGFLFCLFSTGQQNTPWICADQQLDSLQKRLYPAYERIQRQTDIQLRDYVNQMLKGRKNPAFNGRTASDSIFTIPVVIHVMHPAGQPYGTGTNISYAQIRSQIEALNAAFSKNYPSYNGQSHPAYAQDTRIRFCLARTPVDTSKWFVGPGGTEFGVVRYAVNSQVYDHHITTSSANDLKATTHPNEFRFPFDRYLNIWLVKTIGGGNNIMGYAPRPIMGAYPLDGVIMRADIFGDNSPGNGYSLNFGLSQGKVLAHEIGHYLNLYHIFQGGCAGKNPSGSATDACDLNGDMICDIEPATTQNIYCDGSSPNTCVANYATGTTNADMINDFMSYADDDCMNTFTQDQVERMWATLHLQRFNLWQHANLIQTGVMGGSGCVPPYLNAQINADKGVFCSNSKIIFSNPPEGNTATAYQWQFPGGSPSSSTKRTDTVTYAAPGNYTIILTVSNGADQRTDSLVFSVLDCKLDSSMLHMSNWYFGNFGSIDFSSGAPVQTNTAFVKQTMKGESSYTGQLDYVQGTISLSDSLGNLLFYSNAVSVWNKDHVKISTTPIFGESDINASTGVCYVPYPGQPGKYFIVGASANLYRTPDGVSFVEVDLNTNTVGAYRKFQHSNLPQKLSELLTIVPHCNGKDYWIIAHGYDTDTRFYSFLVTENGIDHLQSPVISQATHPGYQGSGNQLKSNRSGNKLILASPHGTLTMEAGAIYDFDNRTGRVFNEKKIPDVPGYNNIQTGAAFSPNEKYFYLFRSTNLETNGRPYWLFQYRMSDLHYNIIPAPGFYFCSPFQPGPDNQIYVTTQDNYFAQISNPDEWGGVSVNGSYIHMMKLHDDVRTGVSIPGFIDARRSMPAKPDFATSILNCNSYRFSTTCLESYEASWDFGDGSPLQFGHTIDHLYLQPGDFNVTLFIKSGSNVLGSVTKKIKVLPLDITINGPDQVCTNGNFPSQYFAPVLPDVDYKWTVSGGTISGADNFPFVDIVWSSSNTSGSLQLQVMRQNCIITRQYTVNIARGPDFNWELRDSVCFYDTAFALYATPIGGTFEGPGVSNGYFSPSVAGRGKHIIRYKYFDERTCPGQIEKMILVAECNIPNGPSSHCEAMLNSIQVAPNPIDGLLQLRSVYVLKNAQVFNSAGQKVAEGQLINNKMQLPVLAAGIYTVLVFCEDSSFRALRFVKLR